MQENSLQTNDRSSSLIPINQRAITFFGVLERVVFSLLVVCLPFRLRATLQSIPYPPVYGDYTDVLFFLTDALLLATLTIWFIRKQIAGTRINWGPWFITLPMLGFMIAGFISALFSVAAIISLMHVVRLSVLFVFYLYLINEIRNVDTLRIPLMLQVGVQAVVAVSQYVLQRSIGLAFLGEFELDPGWFGVSIVWAPGQIALRSYGLADHPNILGGSLALGLLFLIFTAPSASDRTRSPLIAVIALGAAALLLTFSRAAWLGFAVGAGLSSWIYLKLHKTKEIRRILTSGLSAMIVVLPFIFATLPYLSSRLAPDLQYSADGPDALSSPEERSVEERAVLIDAANRMFIDDPLTGTGLGTFPVALRDRFPDFEHYYQPVHFVLLDVATETGLLGALGYLLALFLPFIALWWARARLEISEGLVAATGMLAAVAVIGLFDYYLWFLVPGRLWHWLIWGIWGAYYRRGLHNHE